VLPSDLITDQYLRIPPNISILSNLSDAYDHTNAETPGSTLCKYDWEAFPNLSCFRRHHLILSCAGFCPFRWTPEKVQSSRHQEMPFDQPLHLRERLLAPRKPRT
jgi:hypothetical protein